MGAINGIDPKVLEELVDNYGSARAENLFKEHFNVVMFEIEDDEEGNNKKDLERKVMDAVEMEERKTHPCQFSVYGMEFTVCTKLPKRLASQLPPLS